MHIQGKLQSPEFADCTLPLTAMINGKKVTIGRAFVRSDGYVDAVVDNAQFEEKIRSNFLGQFSIKLNPEVRLEHKPAEVHEELKTMPMMDESRPRSIDPADIRKIRVDRLKAGNYQFGHGGEHHGNDTEGCPRTLHHHCDEFCQQPTYSELREAGINPGTFRIQSRSAFRNGT